MPRLILTATLCLLVGTGVGFFLSEYHFGRAAAYEPTRSLNVTSGTGSGVLPAGTYMSYRNAEHGEVEFYVFVRVPVEQMRAVLRPAAADRYGQHRHLEAQQ